MQKMVMCVVVWMLLVGTAAAEEPLYATGRTLVAVTEEVLDHAVAVLRARDEPAYIELYKADLIWFLDEGTKVQVLERVPGTDKIRIRPYGTNVTLWSLLRFFGNG